MKSEKIQSVITYLEMKKHPVARNTMLPAGVEAIRAVEPPIHFYRYLYNTIGEKWIWYERKKISNDELKKQIYKKGVEIYVLYTNGIPAGYAELDFSDSSNVNLVYFGLMPEFMGKRLGTCFLQWIINKAWERSPKRIWVHTCTLDAPHALDFYKKNGFVPYKTEEVEIIL